MQKDSHIKGSSTAEWASQHGRRRLEACNRIQMKVLYPNGSTKKTQRLSDNLIYSKCKLAKLASEKKQLCQFRLARPRTTVDDL